MMFLIDVLTLVLVVFIFIRVDPITKPIADWIDGK